MKITLHALLFVLLLPCSCVFGSNYFTPVYDGNPYSPMSFLITSVTYHGQVLEIGDEVGVFDGSNCVGAVTFNGQRNLGMSASMDDPTTSAIDGFISGHSISFRLWKKKLNLEVKNVTISYNTNCDKLFEAYGTAIVQLSVPETPVMPTLDPETFTIPENQPDSSLVGTVRESFKASGYKFSIDSGNIENAFRIDSLSGEIFVNKGNVIDYEKDSSYILRIKLRCTIDSTVFTTTLIKVLLTNVNEPPVFSALTTDTLTPGKEFSRNIFASDPDNNIESITVDQLPSWMMFTYLGEGKAILSGIPTATGSDTIVVNLTATDSKGLKVSEPIQFVIRQETQYSDVKIQSTVTEGQFAVVIKNCQGKDVDLYIVNNTGNVIESKKYKDVENEFYQPLDLSGNSRGLYFLRIKIGTRFVTKKIVLQ